MIIVMPQLADNLKIRLSQIGEPVIDVPAPHQMDGAFDSSQLSVQYNVLVKVIRPESRVDVVVSMAYLLGQTKLFSGSLTTGFEVVELASYITREEGVEAFRIDSDFLPMLINIAFSTTRGYFARDLQGTVLAPYPFPMIPMDSIRKRTSYRLI